MSMKNKQKTSLEIDSKARFFNGILCTFHTKCQCSQGKTDLFCPKSSGLTHPHYVEVSGQLSLGTSFGDGVVRIRPHQANETFHLGKP